MKKIIPILIVAAFLAGCRSYGTIDASYDEFKDATVVKMTLAHDGNDHRWLEADYVNTIKNNKSDIKVRMKTNVNANETKIQKQGFFKIDGKKFTVTISNSNQSSQTNSSTTTKTSTNFSQNHGGSSYVDYTKTNSSTPSFGSTTTSTSTSSYTRYYLTGEMELSNEIANALKTGNNILFRIYCGDSPATFKFTPEEQQHLVKFFNTTSAAKK